MQLELLVHPRADVVDGGTGSPEYPSKDGNPVPEEVPHLSLLSGTRRFVGLKNLGDSRGVSLPGSLLLLQPALPGGGQAVELGPPILLRETPLGLDPALALNAMEGLIQGASCRSTTTSDRSLRVREIKKSCLGPSTEVLRITRSTVPGNSPRSLRVIDYLII